MNIEQALKFIDQTIHNHLTDLNTEVRVWYVGPLNYSASIGDPNAMEPHCEVRNCPSIDAALIRLSRAIREDSTIGA